MNRSRQVLSQELNNLRFIKGRAGIHGVLALSCLLGVAGVQIGCSSTKTEDTKTTTVTAPAITTPLVDKTVTEGDSVTFTVVASGTAPLSYQWKKGSTVVGGNSATLSIAATAAGDAGTYTVTVSNASGKTATSSATLTVNPVVVVAPSITTELSNKTVTEGDAVSFAVAADGTGPLHYQWKRDTTILQGDNPTLNIAAASLADAGTYTVTVSNASGQTATSTAVLVVNAAIIAPSITKGLDNQSVSEKTAVTFTVTAAGTAPFHYVWTKDGQPVGDDSATLKIDSAVVADSGTYAVTVSNASGKTVTSSAVLTVTPLPVAPSITTGIADRILKEGQALSFKVVADGTAPFTYAWTKDGAPVGTNSDTLSIATVTLNDAGTYVVTVSNASGKTASSTAMLTVNPVVINTVSLQVDKANPSLGDTVTFTATATGTPGAFEWQKDGQAIANTAATLVLNSVQASDAGSYTVKALYQDSDPATSQAVSLVVDLPTTNLALNKTASATSGTASLAVDGDSGTRWESAAEDPTTITIDLGAKKDFNRVVLNWEAAYGKTYEIQISDDNQAWTTVFTQNNSLGGKENLCFPTVSGQFVRMFGKTRATGYGYSLWDFEVYKAPAHAITVIPGVHGTITPGSTTYVEGASITFQITPDAGYVIKDVIVDGVSQGAVSSYVLSSASKDLTIEAVFDALPVFDQLTDLAVGALGTASSGDALLAVDGDPGTRWESASADPQWITLDLGGELSFNWVVLNWERARAADYEIRVSNDGNAWTTVYSKVGAADVGGNSADYIALGHEVTARYVQMSGTKRATPWSYSLWTFGIYDVQ